MVIYNEDDHVDEVLNCWSVGKSKFIVWMECNKKYPKARKLTYSYFSSKFVWDLQTRTFNSRKKTRLGGLLTYVQSSLGELYYLRVFLNITKGPMSVEDIGTVKGFLYTHLRMHVMHWVCWMMIKNILKKLRSKYLN